MNHFSSRKYTRNYLSKWKVRNARRPYIYPSPFVLRVIPGAICVNYRRGITHLPLRNSRTRGRAYACVSRVNSPHRSLILSRNLRMSLPHSFPYSSRVCVASVFRRWSLLLKGSSAAFQKHPPKTRTVPHARDFSLRCENRLVSRRPPSRTVPPTASRARRCFILSRRSSLFAKTPLSSILRTIKRFVPMQCAHTTAHRRGARDARHRTPTWSRDRPPLRLPQLILPRALTEET